MINESDRFKQLLGLSTPEGKKAFISENFQDNIKDETKEQVNYYPNQLTKFEVLGNGDLKISLTNEGKEYIEDLRNESGDYTKGWSEMISDLFDHEISNGYSYVQPEDIGALTSSLIISNGIIDDETTQEDLDSIDLWWFPQYEVRDEVKDLEDNGFIIFSKAGENSIKKSVDEELDLGFIQYKKDNDLELNDEENETLNEQDEFILEIEDDSEENELEYFVDTYYNGQFEQLKNLLSDLKRRNKIKELKKYIDEFGGEKSGDMISWMIENL